jgi:hypothetical protein
MFKRLQRRKTGLKKRLLGKSLIVSVFLIILLTARGVPASDDNILINPGFEDNQAGQQPTFPPWWEWLDETRKGVTNREVTDEVFHSGKYSAVRQVTGRALGCYAQTIEISPREIVEAGIWIKTSRDFNGSEAYLRIEFKAKDNSTILAVESKRIVFSDEHWKLYTVGPANAPDKTAMVIFGIFLMGKDKNSYGKAWFDDGYVRVKFKGLI